MRAGAFTAPRPESQSEHARAAWRQLLTTSAGAKLAGPQAVCVGYYLDFGMIGQKTLYSFFSPNPARKRSSCSPEPADPGTGVAAVAQSGDVAVRSGWGRGDLSWGQGSGRPERVRGVRRAGRAADHARGTQTEGIAGMFS